MPGRLAQTSPSHTAPWPRAVLLLPLLLPLTVAACREPPPPLPDPPARFAPENLPATPTTYPSLGRVPARPADLPTAAERSALQESLERDRQALRNRQPGTDLPATPEADPLAAGEADPTTAADDGPPTAPLFEVPEPAQIDDLSS